MDKLRKTEWAKRWGWNMFTTAMGSGACMVTIYSVPYSFHGQHAVATIWFIIDVVLFVISCTMMSLRAIKYWSVFKQSFYDQNEAPWIPTFNLSFATILIGIIDLGIPYTGPWLITTCEVLYYVYIFVAIMTAIVIQNTLRLLPRPLHMIGPADCLEAFPLMLAGSIGSLLCSHVTTLRPDGGLTIMLFALVCQGLGFFISILKLSAWMLHHIVLPRAPAQTLPTYMVAVGVPGFTAFALFNVGRAALTILPANGFLKPMQVNAEHAGEIFAVVGVWFGLLCTGFFAWIVIIYFSWGIFNMFKVVKDGPMLSYNMTWWSWTFPLAGMISTWGMYGKYFPSKAFGVLCCIGAIFEVCIWLFNIIGTASLLLSGQMPGSPAEFVPEEYHKAKSEQETNELEPIQSGHLQSGHLHGDDNDA